METPYRDLVGGDACEDCNASGEGPNGEKAAAIPRPPDASTPGTYITQLGENDVLLGRGTGPCSHEGNVRFRDVIEAMRPQYVATPSRKAKTKVVLKTVETIKAKNGRFLRKVKERKMKAIRIPQKELYEIVPDDIAFEKTKQAIRYVHYRKDAYGRNLLYSKTLDGEYLESTSQSSRSKEGSSSASFHSSTAGTGVGSPPDTGSGRSAGRLGTNSSASPSHPRSTMNIPAMEELQELAQQTVNFLLAPSQTAAVATRSSNQLSSSFTLPMNSSASSTTSLLQQLIRRQETSHPSHQFLPTSSGGASLVNMLEQAAAQPHQGFHRHTASMHRQDRNYSKSTLEQSLPSALLTQHQQQPYTGAHDLLQSVLQQQQQANANHQHLKQSQHHLEQALREQALALMSPASGAATTASFGGNNHHSLDDFLLRSKTTTQQLLPSSTSTHTTWASPGERSTVPPPRHPSTNGGNVPVPANASTISEPGGDDGGEQDGMSRPDKVLLQHAIEDPHLRALLLADEKCRQIIESISRS
jgi:hypothetical protein